MEKFKDIFRFAPKSKIKAGEGLDKGKFPFYTSSQIQNKWIDTEQHSHEALIFGTGGQASIHYEFQPFSTSTDCFVTISSRKDVNTKYVYYYLSSNINIIERGFKGAGLKHLSKSYLEKLQISLPDIDTQNKIVAILDKAKSILDKRESAIQLYNDLLTSSFLEMFGLQNPDFNDWEDIEVGSLGKNSKSFRTGPFGSSLKHERFKEEGDVAVLGIDNAVDNVFKWKKKRFLPKDDFEEFKRYQLFPRDVIITIMGTVGRSAVIPDDVGLAINTKHLAAITVDENKCNPYYLSYSIHSNPYVQYQLKARARGAVMEGFNLTLIKELKLKNAPIELQKKFEKIYIKCSNNIARLIEVLGKASLLFKATSQLAFKGELKFNTAVDLAAFLNTIDLDKKDEENAIDDAKTNSDLLQRLINKLQLQDFENSDQYEKAKYLAFRIMKEEANLIKQQFDVKEKKVRMHL